MSKILPSHIFFAFIILAVIISGGISLIYQAAEYHPEITEDSGDDLTVQAFNNTFNRFQNVSNTANQIKERVEGAETAPGLFGFLDELVSAMYNTLQLLFGLFSFVPVVFTGLTTTFGIPWWATAAATIFVTAVIGFTILSLIFKWDV